MVRKYFPQTVKLEVNEKQNKNQNHFIKIHGCEVIIAIPKNGIRYIIVTELYSILIDDANRWHHLI